MFRFNPRKAVQAIGVILRALGCQEIEILRIMKLLYMAERESLKAHRRCIFGGTPLNFTYGPVIEEVYDLHHAYGSDRTWDQYFRMEGVRLVLKQDLPPAGNLSRAECEILRKIAIATQDTDTWELVKQTHDFAEWRDPKGRREEIPFESILEALHLTDDEKADVRHTARVEAIEDSLFGG